MFILSIVLGMISFAVGIFGIILVALLLGACDKSESLPSRIGEAARALLIFAMLSFFFFTMSSVSICREIRYEYSNPVMIIKTNDITHVIIWVQNNKTLSMLSYSDLGFYLSTNIMVKTKIGKNVWGIDDTSFTIIAGK